MSAKPNMSVVRARRAAQRSSAARRSRSAIPLSPSSAATTAPSICGRKRRSATIRSASPTACIIGPRRSPIASSWRSAMPARGWRQITYAQLLASRRHIASALLARGLSAEKPIVILSGNSIDHALLAFGALYAGIPFCPVSPAYSLVSRDYGKLGLSDEAADARPRLRRRRRQVRRCAGGQRLRWHRDRRVARRRARPRRDRRSPICWRRRSIRGLDAVARRDRPGHDRKIPADLGLDRQSRRPSSTPSA